MLDVGIWFLVGFLIILFGFLFRMGFSGFNQFKEQCFVIALILCFLGPAAIVVPFVAYLWEKHVL